MWAVNKYEGMAREAQKHSIYSGILAKLAAGIMGVMFYATYCMAFIFGTCVQVNLYTMFDWIMIELMSIHLSFFPCF